MAKRATPTTQYKIMKIKAMVSGAITTAHGDKTMTRPTRSRMMARKVVPTIVQNKKTTTRPWQGHKE